MTYAPLDFQSIENRELKKVFRHANAYLHDVYGMFRLLPPEDADGGGGNFSIVLVLLCIVDGLATEVWPGRQDVPKQENRFKRLIRCRFPWGPEGSGQWVQKGNAADQLYSKSRNPLVHELGRDKTAASRPADFDEPIIGKWGPLPTEWQDIAKIDALTAWNDGWPIFSEIEADGKPSRYKLCAAGLYWAVKDLAREMAQEAKGL